MSAKLVLMLTLIILGACTSTHQLTSCRGSLQAANPGKWTPTAADLSKDGAR